MPSGATIGLLSLLLPHSPEANDPALHSNVALAYVGGLVLLCFARRFPGWAVHAALVAGALLITRTVVLSGEPVSFYAAWYIWVDLFAFFFFGRPAARGGHVGLVAVLYAGTLANEPASSPLARWMTTVTTLLAAGVFIDMLVNRARTQAEMAAASAARMERVADVAHELAGLSESEAARSGLCGDGARSRAPTTRCSGSPPRTASACA